MLQKKLKIHYSSAYYIEKLIVGKFLVLFIAEVSHHHLENHKIHLLHLSHQT
jgi:hypothetical protein